MGSTSNEEIFFFLLRVFLLGYTWVCGRNGIDLGSDDTTGYDNGVKALS